MTPTTLRELAVSSLPWSVNMFLEVRIWTALRGNVEGVFGSKPLFVTSNHSLSALPRMLSR